jgi:Na+-transporting methylmalonyl-CoA/oxaloacetate decarboxylase gamma subunit
MEVNALVESVKFMFLGMGVVFAFLTIMVYAIKLQAFLIQKFFPVKESVVVTKEQSNPTQENREKKLQQSQQQFNTI